MRTELALVLLLLAVTGALSEYARPSKYFAQRERKVAEFLSKRAEEQKTQPELEGQFETQGTDLSTSYNLRPVENQGQCGSCTAFATSHTFNDYWSIAGCSENNLAEQYFVDCMGYEGYSSYCSSGALLKDAYNLVQKYGIPATSCVPYQGVQLSCPTSCSWKFSSTYSCYSSTPSSSNPVPSVATLQSWLDAGKPFSVIIQLYHQFLDFQDPNLASTTAYPYDSDYTVIGNHALEVVGYATVGGVPSWKIKNSWSSSWGNNGYVYVAQSYYLMQVCVPTNPGYCPTSRHLSPFETAEKTERETNLHIQGGGGPQPDPQKEGDHKWPGYSSTGGGSSAADLTHPLVVECATFAAESLLAMPQELGGFGCINNVNNTFQPTGQEADTISVQIFSGDQQVVSGLIVHVVFSFTTTNSRCAGASGNFDATVYVSATGMLSLNDVHPSTAQFSTSGSEINKAAIAGGAAGAFVVVVLACALGGRRWYRTRMKYKKLKSVHKEVIRRVTLLENDQSTNTDAVRKARLTQILKSGPPEEWDEYSPVSTPAPSEQTPAHVALEMSSASASASVPVSEQILTSTQPQTQTQTETQPLTQPEAHTQTRPVSASEAVPPASLSTSSSARLSV